MFLMYGREGCLFFCLLFQVLLDCLLKCILLRVGLSIQLQCEGNYFLFIIEEMMRFAASFEANNQKSR